MQKRSALTFLAVLLALFLFAVEGAAQQSSVSADAYQGASSALQSAAPTTVALAIAPEPVAPPAGEAATESTTLPERWSWHGQSTFILQGYPGLQAKYSGPNSLPTAGQARETVSADWYGGIRLWSGAEMHMDVLTWQGFGLNNTLGVDAFPNGEAYKVGTSTPRVNIARFFIRHTFGLDDHAEDFVSSDPLTLAGRQDRSRLTLTLGRFSSKDMFDTNAYANDPRTQFMNWALMANAAWDYPSDSLGYTTGIAMEWNRPSWALRYGFFQLPNQRNGFTAESQFLMWPGDASAGDGSFFKSWGMVAEFEQRYSIHSHPGTLRYLGYLNRGKIGSYQAALSVPEANITQTLAYRHVFGFGLNWEQEVTKNIGVFSRIGWNDGHNEAWMFTDINHTASLGVSVKGEAWKRPDDIIGLAGVASGISNSNQEYLQAGGLGVLDGDGALNYGWEKVIEMYYDAKIGKKLHATLDYQFIANPAFNRDRGSVSVFATRLHWEF